MTQNAPLAVGLDIGTTKIVAVVGRLNEHRKIEVLGIGKSKSLGVQRGVVANITLTIESIQAAVKDGRRKFWPENHRGHGRYCRTTHPLHAAFRLHHARRC